MRLPQVALVALLALGLVGCTPASAALPTGVSVSVFQNRFDYGVRQLELKVSNATHAPITITRASFESTRFVMPAEWRRPRTVPAGASRDLKVQLGASNCSRVSAVDTVTLFFTLDDGRSGSEAVTPTDETSRLEVINTEDCVAAALASRATIVGPSAAGWVPGAHEPARLELTVTPTGSQGSATIVFVKGTVLLSLVDASGTETYEQRLDLVIDANSDPSVIQLLVVPARCDAHAVAEDKRGTFLPLQVTTSAGVEGRIYIAVSDSVRESLYKFYGDFCGLP